MRPLSLSLALLMLLALPGMVVADDAENARLEELWKTGSLWQVGDNIPKVEAARKEIVAAGDAGLAFIFTKLNTTDGLEYRCIEAVFKGFGAKALPGLCERMGHEDVKVRRNVAAMLGVIDDKSAAAKMVEHLKKETDLRCRVGHLQTLARWKEPTALDPLIECTRTTQEQEPLAERLKVRIVPLLANYEDEKAISRLIELLDDPAYFIRDAARDALKGSNGWRGRALDIVESQVRADLPQYSRTVVLCALPVAATHLLPAELGPTRATVLIPAIAATDGDPVVRSAAVTALVTLAFTEMKRVPQNTKLDDWTARVLNECMKKLGELQGDETDPLVAAAIDRAKSEILAAIEHSRK